MTNYGDYQGPGQYMGCNCLLSRGCNGIFTIKHKEWKDYKKDTGDYDLLDEWLMNIDSG